MELCLIKLFLPLSEEQNIRQLLSSYDWLETESISKSNQKLAIDLVLEKKRVKTIVDDLKHKLSHLEFKLLVLPVEAIATEDNPNSAQSPDPELNKYTQPEIYTQISESIHLSGTEIALVILSTVIAAIGLVQGSQVVIIGAMVIAPLLKPNMALAIATTFGDLSLAIKIIKVGSLQILLALSLSILLGMLVPVNLEMIEIASRTKVDFADIVLAFASGVAGAISLTIGEQKAVVGVMVSVALLPPLVVFGMLIGSQLWVAAVAAMVLVSTNIVCLNLAAIATFWIRDVRPQIDWKKFQAGKVAGVATVFWLSILAILAIVIFMFEFKTASSAIVLPIQGIL